MTNGSPRHRLVTTASVVVTLTLAAAAVLDVLEDALGIPAATQLAVALAGGVAAILLAFLFAEPGETRNGLLFAASVASVFVVAGLERLVASRLPSVLYVPCLLAVGAAGWQWWSASRLARTLARARQRAMVEGQERERRRWARELHDETLQTLGMAETTLSAALSSDDERQVRRAVGAAIGSIHEQITALRHLIAELRPPALDRFGLGPALDSLARRSSEATGLTVETEIRLAEGEGQGQPTRLLPTFEVTVYRVVQEALSNAVKHSGARRVRITVLKLPDAVVTEIADDGRGFTLDRIEPGFGLSTMRERALLLGGSLRISSRTQPPTGTMIRLRLPVEAQPAAGEGVAAGRRWRAGRRP